MMQWTKGDTGFESKDEMSAVEITSDERPGMGHLFAYVIQSLATALSRVGVTSAMMLILVAVVVATVVFGLTVNEAAAVPGWCRSC